ncbi:LysR family transcriptional regulator [Streptomyces sp. 796.1]|uniref:LysR family transcriptional regulator n=1 Tax=Streptomyces sp. 796.1 TaxID=3163029 RepID=UPI0039C90C25
MTLEIHDLRILRAIAEAGSLAGAARALGTNQGNISRQLQRIERGTGVTLFRRAPRGTTPTDAGHLVLSGAETLLPLIDWLLDAAAREATEQRARRIAEQPAHPARGDAVRIGSVGHPVLPALAGALCTLLPGTALGIHTDDSSGALLDLLVGQELEAAVVRHFPGQDEPLPAGVASAVIAREGLLVGIGDRHPLAGRGSATLRDLPAGTCVLVDSRNHTLRRRFGAAIERTGADLRLSCAADEAAASALACASHAAFAAFPTPAPLPGVAFLPLTDAAARYTLLLAWPRTGRLAPYGSDLAERLRRAYPSPLSD